ncbi:hypothetical protein D3C78_663610 [compost metagenome]
MQDGFHCRAQRIDRDLFIRDVVETCQVFQEFFQRRFEDQIVLFLHLFNRGA